MMGICIYWSSAAIGQYQLNISLIGKYLLCHTFCTCGCVNLSSNRIGNSECDSTCHSYISCMWIIKSIKIIIMKKLRCYLVVLKDEWIYVSKPAPRVMQCPSLKSNCFSQSYHLHVMLSIICFYIHCVTYCVYAIILSISIDLSL